MSGNVMANGRGRPASPAAPVPPVESVGFAPAATEINLGVVEAPDGEKFVMLQFKTASGIGVYFIPPEGARTLAAQVVAIADQAIGLHLPPASPFG